jgi:hypothetical protein
MEELAVNVCGKSVMKKIKIFLDYQCYPIWVYDDNGELINNDLPDEIINEAEIGEKLEDIQNSYNHLFEDNDSCFEYKGFINEKDKREFLSKIERVMELLTSKLGDIYILENKVSI